MGEKAVLLVDFQYTFLKPDFFIESEYDGFVDRAIEIARTGIENKIFVLSVTYKNCGRAIDEIRDCLKPSCIPRFQKSNGNAFLENGRYSCRGKYGVGKTSKKKLEEALHEEGISTIVVTGINSYCCANSTIKGAKKSGFEVITSPDLILNRLGSDRDGYRKYISELLPNYKSVTQYLNNS